MTITITVGTLFGSIVFAAILFAFYLSYCTLRVARENGKLQMAPKIVQAMCWLILGLAFLLDIAFNITVGTIAFLELPSLRRPTFTQRCEKHMQAAGFRGRLARWVCDGWLNPFEAGHCHK